MTRLLLLTVIIRSITGFFTVNNIYICFSIDASNNDRIGRFVNDSPRRMANSIAKSILVNDTPRIVLFAAHDIDANIELRFDYGTGGLPWRTVCSSFV